MGKGRRPTREILEEKHGDFWKYMHRTLKGITDIAEAVKAIVKTGTPTSPPTVVKMIQLGVDNGEIAANDPLTKILVKPKGKRRGKPSLKEVVEEALKVNFWDLLRTKFSDCNSLEEAQAKLLALSGGKIVTTPITIKNTIDRGKAAKEVTDKDPFLQWIAPKVAGQRGKETVKSRVEKMFPGKTIWDIFNKHFKGIEHAEGAATKLAEVTDNAIDTSSFTIKATIQRGVDAGEVKESDFYHAWLTAKPARKQVMSKSLQGKLARKGHNDMLACFREAFKGLDSVDAAPDMLHRKFGVKACTATIKKAIEQGLSDGAIDKTETFAPWGIIRHRKPKSDADAVDTDVGHPSITVEMTCNECGHQWHYCFTDYGNHDIGFLAMRCSACMKWGNFSARGVTGGITFYKKSFLRDPDNTTRPFYWTEAFCDEEGNKCKCPLKEQSAQRKERKQTIEDEKKPGMGEHLQNMLKEMRK